MRDIGLINVPRGDVLAHPHDHLAIPLPAHLPHKARRGPWSEGHYFSLPQSRPPDRRNLPRSFRVAVKKRPLVDAEAKAPIVFHVPRGKAMRQAIIRRRLRSPPPHRRLEPLEVARPISFDDFHRRRGHDRNLPGALRLQRRIEKSQPGQVPQPFGRFQRREIAEIDNPAGWAGRSAWRAGWGSKTAACAAAPLASEARPFQMNSFRYPCALPPMKALPALLTASLLLAGTLLAEEEAAPAPAKPKPSDASAAPAGDAAATPAPATAPAAVPGDKPAQLAPGPAVPADGARTRRLPCSPLIPETQTTFVKPPPSPTWVQHHERPSKTEQSETDLQARVRMRIAPDQGAARIPPSRPLSGPRTSLPRTTSACKHLQHYYTLLYDRVAKIDNRFPLLLADTRKASIVRVTQAKLEPSIAPAVYPDTAAPAPTVAPHRKARWQPRRRPPRLRRRLPTRLRPRTATDAAQPAPKRARINCRESRERSRRAGSRAG